MKFGTPVWVERGGGSAPGTPGSLRKVRGTLVGAKGYECIVRLDQDDPLSTIQEWTKRGAVGRWSRSVVTRCGNE